MNRNEIAETLRQWIAEGKMFSTANAKQGWNERTWGWKKVCFGSCSDPVTEHIYWGPQKTLEEGCMVGTSIYTGAIDSLKGLSFMTSIRLVPTEEYRFDALGKSATLYIEQERGKRKEVDQRSMCRSSVRFSRQGRREWNSPWVSQWLWECQAQGEKGSSDSFAIRLSRSFERWRC